jgi:hypothetical protein
MWLRLTCSLEIAPKVDMMDPCLGLASFLQLPGCFLRFDLNCLGKLFRFHAFVVSNKIPSVIVEDWSLEVLGE